MLWIRTKTIWSWGPSGFTVVVLTLSGSFVGFTDSHSRRQESIVTSSLYYVVYCIAGRRANFVRGQRAKLRKYRHHWPIVPSFPILGLQRGTPVSLYLQWGDSILAMHAGTFFSRNSIVDSSVGALAGNIGATPSSKIYPWGKCMSNNYNNYLFIL